MVSSRAEAHPKRHEGSRARTLKILFNSLLALFLLPKFRSKSFLRPGNSYQTGKFADFYFERLADGMPHALAPRRRSGAQRGAPGNNFGQRFSWAPLAFVSGSIRHPPRPWLFRSAPVGRPTELKPTPPARAHQFQPGATSAPPLPASAGMRRTPPARYAASH